MSREVGNSEAPDIDVLCDELRWLRKGPGLTLGRLRRASNVLSALRARVQQRGAYSSAVSLAATHGLLISELEALGQSYIGRAVRNAFALGSEENPGILTQRRAAFAASVNRHTDTIEKWENGGIDELASRLSDVPSFPGPSSSEQRQSAQKLGLANREGWYLESFRVLLRMDKRTPETFEERRIVATTAGLDEVTMSTTIRRHRSDDSPGHHLIVEPEYGCALGDLEHITDVYFRQHIRLPRPLVLNESHDYGLRVRIPEGQPMVPIYALTALRRCDSFSLRVRFSSNRLPRCVWRIDGLPVPLITDWDDPDDLLTLDAMGEVHVSFVGLRTGLSYGLRWGE